ncbi:DUF805 domain-containing protein [Turicibacter sp. TJ11]|uniref:DUF805 domain-containing protein n=1 Tax=Turicibacter sp. TJ11 TaxID=2806443 RepID=UPI001F1FD77E|nr:DUF805 domain-containing protein [Turicibacter sp. TJ11]
MEFVEAYRSFWKNYFNFKGRATRSEFWFVVVWNMIIGIVLGLGLSLSFVGTAFSLVALGNGFSANVIFTILFGGLLVIYGLASFIPCLSLAVRRCRDTGLSGWWYIGLYITNLLIVALSGGGIWLVISFLVNLAIFIISVLPTDQFSKTPKA